MLKSGRRPSRVRNSSKFQRNCRLGRPHHPLLACGSQEDRKGPRDLVPPKAAPVSAVSAARTSPAPHPIPAKVFVEPPDHGKKAPPSAADPNPEASAPGGLRVLVVDDDAGVRDVAVRLLEFEGVHATSVASGHEALELLDSESFDCVLLDLTMPRFSGSETFRALRLRNQELPVVFSSGQRDFTVDSLVGEGKNAYFLDKPFTPRRLLDIIARACKR